MNINGMSRFSQAPSGLDIKRSLIRVPYNHKTTFNAGDLIPVFVHEVLPGSSFKIDLSALVRSSTEIYPVLDSAFLDVYFFFVPRRIVWDHWKEFNGENNVSAWTPSTTYSLPKLELYNLDVHSLFSYFGAPVGTDSHFKFKFDAAYPRAYNLIWNEWFRNPALQAPLLVYTGDSAESLSNYSVRKSGRFHDYFSSSLPAPQYGAAVELPLDPVPVVTSSIRNDVFLDNSLTFRTKSDSGSLVEGQSYSVFASNVGAAASHKLTANIFKDYDFTTSGNKQAVGVIPDNLVAMLNLAGLNVNMLRQSFALQKFLERSARCGSRYFESIRAHFGTIVPDATVQRPEYLGGFHQMLGQTEVVQTSSTDAVTPLGQTAGMSKTITGGQCCLKSFSEHGIIMGLATVRHDRTYQQGLRRIFSRDDLYSFYFPEFAALGEQPVRLKELYIPKTNEAGYNPEAVWGYQEAWAEYRYMPNQISGQLRSGVTGSLDAWHYGDYYATKPVLSSSWMEEGTAEIDRTLAVKASVSDQFIGDFEFTVDMRLPMPVFSIPGMIDHF